jgi:tagatose 6-phosphate kinase
LGLKLPASKLIKKLHYLGPKTVVITCGARNILALNQDKIYSLTPPKIKVVQTTGSGDAFTSGLLAGIIKGYDFKDSLILGQVNAASVIGQVGAKEGLLTLKEASKLMKRYKINVNSN